MLYVVMLNVAFSYYAECRYAECHCTDKTNSICQGQILRSIFLALALSSTLYTLIT